MSAAANYSNRDGSSKSVTDSMLLRSSRRLHCRGNARRWCPTTRRTRFSRHASATRWRAAALPWWRSATRLRNGRWWTTSGRWRTAAVSTRWPRRPPPTCWRGRGRPDVSSSPRGHWWWGGVWGRSGRQGGWPAGPAPPASASATHSRPSVPSAWPGVFTGVCHFLSICLSLFLSICLSHFLSVCLTSGQSPHRLCQRFTKALTIASW